MLARRVPLVLALTGVHALAACQGDLSIAKPPSGPVDTAPPPGGAIDLPDIEVSPAEVSFGQLQPNCSAEQLVTITNVGDADLEVTDIRITGAKAYVYALSRARPRTVGPGQSFDVTVTFTPDDYQPFNAARVQVDSDDPDEPTVEASLQGRGDENSFWEELFVQEQQSDVDVLWTIDQSGSMSGEVADLADAFSIFIEDFVALGLNYRIAVTTADGDCSDFNGPYIDNSDPDPVGTFQDQATQARACGGEEGFSAARSALQSSDGQGFLRPDAALSVIAVSDEEEQSGGFSPRQFATWLAGLKGGDMNRVSFNALTGPDGQNTFIPVGGCPVTSGADADVAPRYHSAIRLTGGVWGNLCDFDVRPFLNQVSFVAAGLLVEFPLAELPLAFGSDAIQVMVNGQPVPKDLFDGWSYDPVDNEIVFHGSAVPDPGATITITYPYQANCTP